MFKFTYFKNEEGLNYSKILKWTNSKIYGKEKIFNPFHSYCYCCGWMFFALMKGVELVPTNSCTNIEDHTHFNTLCW